MKTKDFQLTFFPAATKLFFGICASKLRRHQVEQNFKLKVYTAI